MANNVKLYLLMISVSFLIWPFSFSGVSSQILSLVLMFFIIYDIRLSIKYRDIFLLLFFPVCIILLVNIAINNNDSIVLLFYFFKTFLIYFYAKYLLDVLRKLQINNDLMLYYISLSVIFFVLFIIFQIIFPNINNILMRYMEDYRVVITREDNMAGHPWRFLGWNGFLYASHAVGLAFSAIFLLTCRYKIILSPTIRLLFCSFLLEILCLGFALLAGRSAIPLVLVYIILYLLFQKSIIRKINCILILFVVLGLLSIFIMNMEDNAFLVWLTEPINNLINGRLQSNSVDDLNITYMYFLQSLESNLFLRDSMVFGLGIYSTNNLYYEYIGLPGSDSGIIRTIYAVGMIGTFFFLFFFFFFFLFSVIANIRKKGNLYYSYLLGFFWVFGLVFFYKSEWLYQNFFLFYFFFLYHLSIDNA